MLEMSVNCVRAGKMFIYHEKVSTGRNEIAQWIAQKLPWVSINKEDNGSFPLKAPRLRTPIRKETTHAETS